MSLEKTNTKITLNGVLNISDYERKLRSQGNQRKFYRGDLINYIESKNLDPIVKEKVLAETASIPCQAINHVFPRLDDLIKKIEKQVNQERNSISEIVVIPEKLPSSIDIGDLYNSIANVSEYEEKIEEEILDEEELSSQSEEVIENKSEIEPENYL